MRVGVPTEVKNSEFRVAVTPAGVHALVGRGHEVLVQAGLVWVRVFRIRILWVLVRGLWVMWSRCGVMLIWC